MLFNMRQGVNYRLRTETFIHIEHKKGKSVLFLKKKTKAKFYKLQMQNRHSSQHCENPLSSNDT